MDGPQYNYGYDYEKYVIAHLATGLTTRNYNFDIKHNVPGMKCIDDLLVKINKTWNYYWQIKVRTGKQKNPVFKNLNLYEEYFGQPQLQDKHKNDVFILYTNASSNLVNENYYILHEITPTDPLLNTVFNTDGKIYKIENKNARQDSIFLSKCYLFSSQFDPSEVDNIIKSHTNLDLDTEIQLIKTRIDKVVKANEDVSSDSIRYMIAEILIKSHIEPLITNNYQYNNSKIILDTMKNFSCTCVSKDVGIILQRMIINYLSEVGKKPRNPFLMWKEGSIPLLLRYSTSIKPKIQFLVTTLKCSSIILVNDTMEKLDFLSESNVFKNANDIKDNTWIKSVRIDFSNDKTTSLQEYLGEGDYRLLLGKITPSLFVQILTNGINIKTDFIKMDSIIRNVEAPFFKDSVFHEKNNLFFVWNKEASSESEDENIIKDDSEKFSYATAEKEISKYLKDRPNAHYFYKQDIRDTELYEKCLSYGDFKLPKEHRVKYILDENNIPKMQPKIIRILSGEPGIGKSSFLKKIGSHTSRNVLTIYINHMDKQLDWNFQNKHALIKVLTSEGIKPEEYLRELYEELVYYKWEHGEVLLLIDHVGKIELPSLNTNNNSVWITTSDKTENFKYMTFRLKPFEVNDLKQLMSDNKFDISKGFEQNFECYRKSFDGNFLGIISQLNMLFRIVKDLAQKDIDNFKFDLINILIKYLDNELKGSKKLREDWEIQMKHSFFEKLALKQYFNSFYLNKMGVINGPDFDNYQNMIKFNFEKNAIVDKYLHFKNLSLAEYFCAHHIAKNILCNNMLSTQYVTLYTNLFYSDLMRIRYLFDRIMTKDEPIHSAVLKNDKETVKRLLNSSTDNLKKVDRMGRNILHLILSYGDAYDMHEAHDIKSLLNVKSHVTVNITTQSKSTKTEWTITDCNDDKENFLFVIDKEIYQEVYNAVKYNKISILQKDKLGKLPHEYGILNGSLKFLNDLYLIENYIDLYPPKVPKYNNLLAYYCTRDNYVNILKYMSVTPGFDLKSIMLHKFNGEELFKIAEKHAEVAEFFKTLVV